MATTKQRYPTVRISAETHKLVKQMAEEDGTSMTEIFEQSIEHYRRKWFWEHANDVWRRKMQDPEEREFWRKEDAEIDKTFWTPIHGPYEGRDQEE